MNQIMKLKINGKEVKHPVVKWWVSLLVIIFLPIILVVAVGGAILLIALIIPFTLLLWPLAVIGDRISDN